MTSKKCANCNVYDATEGRDWCVKCRGVCKSDGSLKDNYAADLDKVLTDEVKTND